MLCCMDVIDRCKHQQNKSEVDHDRLQRLREREDLGPSPNNNRIPPSPKSSSGQDAFYKMEDGEDKGTQQSPVKSIEITSILNGLQGSNTCEPAVTFIAHL